MHFLPRLTCLALLAQGAGAATPGGPNVVLVTLDTTRADRMGFLGSARGLTPNLDALARQGAVMLRAYSQVPLTSPSHATILTGTYPQFHRVNDFGVALGGEVPYLPQILHDRGYRTAAFVASVVLDPKSGSVPGFDRGFDVYDAGFAPPSPGEDRYRTVERRGAEVVARALAWLESHRQGPFFLWVHLFDPHAPYEPPEPFKSRFPADPYDGEIAYADAQVGKLLDALRARSLYDRTLVAVMADHGEAFGEHGEQTHGVFLYDETIHVPLLFKMPDGRFAGKRVDARGSLVDVMPTILEAAGIPAPRAVQGQSLVGLIAADGRGAAKADGRPSYAETDYPHIDFGWSSLRALRSDKYLFVQAPRPELYDQSADPRAQRNLAATAASAAQGLSRQLAAFRGRTAGPATSAKPAPRPELAQQLAALGYVASSGSPTAGSEMTGADPKDKIEIANRVQDALLAQQDGRAAEAIRILEQVLAKDAGIASVHRTLGVALLAQGNFARAVTVLRKAVELRPESSIDRYQLGMALFNAGDLASASKELQAAVLTAPAGNPHSLANLHYALAGVYNRMGRAADVIKELQAAVQLEADNYDMALTLGRLLSMQGNHAAGVPYLQRASRLRPGSPDPHSFLADAYAQLGQAESAARERLEAERLRALGSP